MRQNVRVRIFISGRVQGVFFRHNTRKKARELGINGWVKNLPDGRVESVMEGEKEKAENLIEWLRKGPIIARVDGTEVFWEEYKGEFNDFVIKYD